MNFRVSILFSFYERLIYRCIRNSVKLLKRRNIFGNKFDSRNLGLLIFLCNLGSAHGHFILFWIFLPSDSPLIASERCLELCNRPLYRYRGHIELIRFEEYYGMPKGHSLSIYAHFSSKKRTSLYISREKGDHFYTNGTTFFPITIFF